jgi:hypothetical protein
VSALFRSSPLVAHLKILSGGEACPGPFPQYSRLHVTQMRPSSRRQLSASVAAAGANAPRRDLMDHSIISRDAPCLSNPSQAAAACGTSWWPACTIDHHLRVRPFPPAHPVCRPTPRLILPTIPRKSSSCSSRCLQPATATGSLVQQPTLLALLATSATTPASRRCGRHGSGFHVRVVREEGCELGFL